MSSLQPRLSSKRKPSLSQSLFKRPKLLNPKEKKLFMLKSLNLRKKSLSLSLPLTNLSRNRPRNKKLLKVSRLF
jgi:hypothetical protein